MSIHLYALRLETSQLVAAEVSDATAARLIDASETVFLGTEWELIALARRRRSSVTILSRQVFGRNGTRPAHAVAGARTSPARELAEVA